MYQLATYRGEAMPLLRINADFINRGEDLCKRVFVSSWFFFVLEILRTRLLTVSCCSTSCVKGRGKYTKKICCRMEIMNIKFRYVKLLVLVSFTVLYFLLVCSI